MPGHIIVTGATGFTIGFREDYPAGGWKGDICEVLVYDQATHLFFFRDNNKNQLMVVKAPPG